MHLPGAYRPLLLALLLGAPSRVTAQGAVTVHEPYAHGKVLADWITESSHYVPEVRRDAFRAMAALGPAARPALAVLIRGTRDDDEEVRYWAVEALRRLGPAARPAASALVLVLSDDTRRLQQSARLALEAIGPAAVNPLLPALAAPDPWLRANAAEALGTLGVAGGKVVSGLAGLLADDSLWVRASAAWALGQLGRPAHKAAGALRNSLAEELRRDPNLLDRAQRVRVENLVFALGRMGKDASPAVPLLLSVLHDEGDSLRSAAAVALAGVGAPAARALGLEARSGPRPVQLEALRSLRLMGPSGKAALGDLTRLLSDHDELDGGHDLVIAAADAIGSMGKDARKGLGALQRQRKMSVTPDVITALDRAIRNLSGQG